MNDREKLFNLLDSAISESKKFCKEQEKCESCRYIEFGAKCQEMAQVDYLIANGVNLASVVHGYWREYNRSALVSWKNGEPVWVDRAVYYCDGCSFGTIIKHNYCPRCGQKMDGGVSDG